MSTRTAHPHADFYVPGPREDGRRMETYRLPRTDDEGRTVGSVLVQRCQECGSATYDGVLRD